MLAKVHATCKISNTLPLPTEHDYIQTAVNPTEVIEGGVDVQELDSENISIQFGKTEYLMKTITLLDSRTSQT